MDPWAEDGFDFKSEATLMLLEWEHAESRRTGEPAVEAIRRVCELTVKTEHLTLDDGAIVGFIRQLAKPDREAVTRDTVSHQQSEPWKTALASGYGTWSRVLKALSGTGKLTKAGRVVEKRR